ncbi:phage-related protein [Leifsonia xyli subsp. xyli str. CTCB07]|uniref:Phage-related protein n=1 Tax=Leifsonia xyli subsp. xyli (strain CTCB07) TaxID=281090 RepID=Q6AC63_LEIXX|nr:phage-related protein [Leifsonia xyli subsp. xyli str. CTCB07]
MRTDAVFTASILIPLARDPLSLNLRLHWRTVAKHTKIWREFAATQAARFPHLGCCTVTLTWHVLDRRRRDADNLFRLCKALCDGLVDAGVTLDDTPHLMDKHCRILVEDRRLHPSAWMTLTIEQVPA